MSWSDQIFRYCERGTDPAFWAEPINAVTNLAFILAALLALRELRSGPSGARRVEGLLVAVMFAIGIGSFLFHTFATRWASVADSAPIGVFMLAYLVYALRRFLALGWVWTAMGLAAFVAALQFAGDVECSVGLISAVEAARHPCLNGTAGYVPAWIAMMLIGAALAVRGHPAWGYLVGAGLVFLVSMTFRTLDWEVCELTRFAGHAAGTHFLWHLLNASVLFLLTRAAIRHGSARGGS